MFTEKQVNLAAKLYDARKTALALLGPEKFKTEIAEYQHYIRCAQDKLNCNEVQAVTDIVKTLMKGGHDGIPIMLALAAYVEMIEPTPGL
jgi:hypothetical protein